jgi:hypothetical protein
MLNNKYVLVACKIWLRNLQQVSPVYSTLYKKLFRVHKDKYAKFFTHIRSTYSMINVQRTSYLSDAFFTFLCCIRIRKIMQESNRQLLTNESGPFTFVQFFSRRDRKGIAID